MESNTAEELRKIVGKTVTMLDKGIITTTEASAGILHHCIAALKGNQGRTADVLQAAAEVPPLLREIMKVRLEAREPSGLRQWWSGCDTLSTPYPIRRPLNDDPAEEQAIQKM